MWLEYLNNNIFLKRLYNTVPELDNIEISKFIIKDISITQHSALFCRFAIPRFTRILVYMG
ncbi:MAG: hypothetical protein K6G26_13230, partial [Lachnospiraceae bacterium]|nr:hypothetical protein [Lachnospiraceae bacterium]